MTDLLERLHEALAAVPPPSAGTDVPDLSGVWAAVAACAATPGPEARGELVVFPRDVRNMPARRAARFVGAVCRVELWPTYSKPEVSLFGASATAIGAAEALHRFITDGFGPFMPEAGADRQAERRACDRMDEWVTAVAATSGVAIPPQIPDDVPVEALMDSMSHWL